MQGYLRVVAEVARASYESARGSRRAVIFVGFFVDKKSLEFFRKKNPRKNAKSL